MSPGKTTCAWQFLLPGWRLGGHGQGCLVPWFSGHGVGVSQCTPARDFLVGWLMSKGYSWGIHRLSSSCLVIALPIVRPHWRRDSLCYHVSISPDIYLCVSFINSLLCIRSSPSPQFFPRMSCFVCRYRFSVYVGGGGVRSFITYHLGPTSSSWK